MSEIDFKNNNSESVLKQVKSMVSHKWMADINEFIDESEYTYDFKIVKEPIGDKQSEDFSFKECYVNQTCNGGYTGDDFTGSICIYIGSGKYLFFRYEM